MGHERVIGWHEVHYSARWLDTKPYKEVYDGRAHRKMSPQRAHALLQGRLWSLLDAWATRSGEGEAGTELRVYLDPETSLVPDVSWISDVRLRQLSPEEREYPPFAPELAVEIRSPRQRKAGIARKTELYLAHGAIAVLDVDPRGRSVGVTTNEGASILREGDVFEHAAFPGLCLRLAEIFAPLDRLA
jgi:Uma2 family endonuclease